MAPKHGLGRGMDALLGDMGGEPSQVPEYVVPEDEDAALAAEETAYGEEAVVISEDELAGAAGAQKQDGGETAEADEGEGVVLADVIVKQPPDVLMVPLDRLRANPEQPRRVFDEEALQELADSIREHGIIQPIIVEEDTVNLDGTSADSTSADGSSADDGGAPAGYIIVAGERRSRAARMAGLAAVPVIVRSFPGAKRLEVSLIENVQRENLNPVEEASAYKALMDLSGCSQEEIAERVGKNRSTVANALRLLKLPEDMRESLSRGEISPGHARALLSVEDAAARKALFAAITAKGLSVREAEKKAAASKKARAKPAAAVPSGRAPEIDAMEEKFIGMLGTKVVIDGDLNRGSIRIDYYSMEDLERLYEILGNGT